MKRAVGILILFLLSVGAAGSGGASAQQAIEPTKNPAEWQADLTYLATELPRLHLNAFHTISAQTWADEVASIDAAIPGLADHEIQVRLMRLLAMVGDAHTSLYWVSARYPSHAFPIALSNRPDGLFVTAVTAEAFATPRGPGEYSRAIGARLISIGGVEIDEVRRRVLPLIPTENAFWAEYSLASYLVIAEVLHALRIIPSLTEARYVVEDGQGNRLALDLRIAPGGWPSFGFPGVRRWQAPLPLTQPSSVNYWYRYLPEERALYFRYRRCAEQAGLPSSTFLQEWIAALETQPVDRLIIDLRDNTGGDSRIFEPFVAAIRARPWINQPGKLFVLINQGTFSSGVFAANSLQLQTNATLLGEPTGGKPNSYGEVRGFLLPNSGMGVSYSTKLFRLRTADDPPGVMPNRRIPYPWSALDAGRDPVLEAALERN